MRNESLLATRGIKPENLTYFGFSLARLRVNYDFENIDLVKTGHIKNVAEISRLSHNSKVALRMRKDRQGPFVGQVARAIGEVVHLSEDISPGTFIQSVAGDLSMSLAFDREKALRDIAAVHAMRRLASLMDLEFPDFISRFESVKNIEDLARLMIGQSRKDPSVPQG